MSNIPLSNLFKIKHGTKLDLNKMCFNDENGINFVTRSRENLGVSAKVEKIDNIDPLPEGTITVSLGGHYLLSSFVQLEPYYTAQNIKVLTPKKEMKFNEKLFYTLCISRNRYKYSNRGREANRSLDNLLVPDLDSIPKWVREISIDNYNPLKNRVLEEDFLLKSSLWKGFRYDELFIIKKGRRLNKGDLVKGELPFISAIEGNNGVRQYINKMPLHEGNTITVNYDGSIGESFYQEKSFWASDSVNVLYPKFPLNKYIGLFLTTLIRKEIYRFNYGRKWHIERMKESIIKLPVTYNGKPDWKLMENYIKSLPYSASL